ncbi:hypothetical protein B4O99_03220 [Shewanella xiamenensis]|nr:hypothetical protein [Shewanella xiamenensis]
MGKSKSRITNWPEYNKALTNRGSLTFWIDEQALNLWCHTLAGVKVMNKVIGLGMPIRQRVN